MKLNKPELLITTTENALEPRKASVHLWEGVLHPPTPERSQGLRCDWFIYPYIQITLSVLQMKS